MCGKIYQYRAGSKSAGALAQALGIAKLLPNTKRYDKPRPNDVVINWGASALPFKHPQVLNKPEHVKAATDKLECLNLLADAVVHTIDFTADPTHAATNYEKTVVRHKLRASGGDGIEIVERGNPMPRAPLYTRYTPKTAEFRVHVAFGEVIDTQRKIARPGEEPKDWQVRNHENGFIFVRNSGLPTADSLDNVLRAVDCLKLDFAAVDIIENKRGTYILEVNTAPGLEGQTLESYKKAFEQYFRNRR